MPINLLAFIAWAFLIVLPRLTFAANLCEIKFLGDSVSEVYFSFQKPGKFHKSSTGVEVEAMIPKETGIVGMADEAATILESQGYKIEKLYYFESVGRSYFKTRVFQINWEKDSKVYELKITQDFSVVQSRGYSPVEIVSPIMWQSDDAEEYFKVIDHLRALGLKEEPNSSGVHVHVGVPEISEAELGIISWLFVLFEDLIREEISFSPFRTEYVGFKKPQEIESIRSHNLLNQGVEGHLDQFYGQKEDRYVGVNLASLRRFGTIEFRLFNSSVNPRVLRFARHLVRKAVQKVRSGNRELLEVMRDAELGNLDLNRLMKVVGLDLNRSWEVLELMREEHARSSVSPMGRYVQKLSNLPQTFDSAVVRTVLVPQSAPPGWTFVPAN